MFVFKDLQWGYYLQTGKYDLGSYSIYIALNLFIDCLLLDIGRKQFVRFRIKNLSNLALHIFKLFAWFMTEHCKICGTLLQLSKTFKVSIAIAFIGILHLTNHLS